nr:MAG TPA: hypothetical protein [Caudoviricetes sp.]
MSSVYTIYHVLKKETRSRAKWYFILYSTSLSFASIAEYSIFVNHIHFLGIHIDNITMCNLFNRCHRQSKYIFSAI